MLHLHFHERENIGKAFRLREDESDVVAVKGGAYQKGRGWQQHVHGKPEGGAARHKPRHGDVVRSAGGRKS